ncbi:uncharacterized protein LOC114518394 [Dendronephthya gigantea]|uniref:uncharacterized protein LOC114518394 n=1 Tax=Dendronephthya gigantea TaxID=151771 RepID=UPI00106D59F2|nr:uncharacterized protein LOC114518394 [Dendronephthya gigantea]
MGNSYSQSNIPDSLKSSPYFTFLAKLFQDISTVKDGSQIGTISGFKEIFQPDENVTIIELLFKYFNAIAGNVPCQELDKPSFIIGFDKLLKLEYGSQDMVTFYVEMLSDGKEKLDCQDIATILSTTYSLQHKDKVLHAPHFQAFAKHLLNQGKNNVNTDKFVNGVFQLWPRIFIPIHCWILSSLSKQSSSEIALPKQRCTRIQLLSPSSSDSNEILDSLELWLLSISIPSLFLKINQKTDKHEESFSSEWRRLYDSNEHGLSHNRFKHHCFSYREPTVMAIFLENNVKLVLAMDTEWRESSRCFGSSDTRLYQVNPEFKILADKNIVLFNEKNRGLPVGLILGNNPSKPQVSLLDGLTTVSLGYLGGQESSVQRIQVFGCAGLRAETDQKQQQNWEKRQAEQLQKVKLPGAWDENPDKAILEMAGITTEHARR